VSLDFIRVPLDSTGKRTAARSVTIPAGTTILDASGTQSTLASDTTCFVQQVIISASVSDTPEIYVPGDIQPLSVNQDGRLRVVTVPAPNDLEFFAPMSSTGSDNPWDHKDNPWSI
jgi:hypothetical protein